VNQFSRRPATGALRFDSKAEAVAYCEQNGIAYRVFEPATRFINSRRRAQTAMAYLFDEGPLKVRAFRQGDGKARWPEPVSPRIGRCTSYGAALTAVRGGTKSNRRQLLSASSSGAPATQ
jgi:hypothetical protein